MTIVIIIAIVIVIVLIFLVGSNNNRALKNQTDIETANSKIETAFIAGEINEEHKYYLSRKIAIDLDWLSNIDKKIEAFKYLKQHQLALIQKYGEDIGNRLVNHSYWIGMTEEQLIDCKGRPDKIETQAEKTITKHTYIYGKKSSGDYFVLENGVVIKFIDR